MSEEKIIIRGLYQNNLKHVPLDIPKGRMMDRSNTVIVIAHNLDVMKQADWSIDVGPVGGSEAAVTICK